MTSRTHVIAVFFVMLLMVVACGVSFADAAGVAADRCGSETGWGPAKVDPSASVKPFLDVPAIPVTFVDVSEPAPRWAGVEGATPAPSRVVVVQSRAPRAPPLA